MGKDTTISWTHHTFSPWWGCDPVSPACLHCYAEAWAARCGWTGKPGAKGNTLPPLWGRGSARRFFGDAHWLEPLNWNKAAAEEQRLYAENPLQARFNGRPPERPRVFCASMADVFEDRTDLTPHLARLLDLIRLTPNLDYLLLTKRPELWEKRITAATRHIEDAAVYRESHEWCVDWLTGDKPPANVWMGATAENQHYADTRIPALLRIPVRRVRFLSMEPLLGPVDITWAFPQTDPVLLATMVTRPAEGINWVIVGGESGGADKRRPFEIAWLESIAAQCDAAGVKLHVKQDAGGKSGLQGRIPDHLWLRKEFPEAAA